MKIRMTIEPSFDNEIRFYDACMAAAAKLTELAKKALDDGDHEQFLGTSHEVIDENDDEENIGRITVTK